MDLPYPLILASNSPRRKEILEQAGFNFRVVVRKVEEQFPLTLSPVEAVKYIANEKIKSYKDLTERNIVLCADTIVVYNQQVLGKPENEEEAFLMLSTLSGKTHKVITAVVLGAPGKIRTFTELTNVDFEDLSNDEINFYIEHWKPFDKAGSYGIQEWIGLIGIKEIHGSYFNVVGLPIHRVYKELKALFI